MRVFVLLLLATQGVAFNGGLTLGASSSMAARRATNSMQRTGRLSTLKMSSDSDENYSDALFMLQPVDVSVPQVMVLGFMGYAVIYLGCLYGIGCITIANLLGEVRCLGFTEFIHTRGLAGISLR